MGLLDDAIREHLDLKRRSGGDPAEIERLEREALGPVRREFPGSTALAEDPRGHESAHPADDVHGHEQIPLEPEGHGGLGDDFGHESHDEPVEEPRRRGFLRRALSSVIDDEPEAMRPEPAPRREPPPLALEGTPHHDDEPEAAGGGHAAAAPSTPPDEQATQVHRVVEPVERDEPVEQREPVDPPLERVEHDEPGTPEAPPAAPGGSGAAPEPAEHAPADEPDPLEETPEFLQDAPEHDRLWFEQRPPRDFDFDG